MDDVSSLMSSAGVDPRIKKKGDKYIVEGIGEFDSYQAAVDALDNQTGDKISGEGPTMTSGESAMDFGEEQSALDQSAETTQAQPGSKAPGATSTGQPKDAQPAKPEWVTQQEKQLGIEYEWDTDQKKWLPKKDKGLLAKATTPNAPTGDVPQQGK
jgi:hypothetical protein